MTHTKIVLQAIPSIPGATHHEIAAATGMTEKAVQRALDRLKPSGLVAYAKVGRINFYYVDQAAKEAGEYALQERCAKERAEAKAETKRKDTARGLARYHNKKRLSGDKRGPKPAAPVKACLPAGSLARPVAGGPARLPGDPVITANTKFTIAPPPPSVLYHTTTFSRFA